MRIKGFFSNLGRFIAAYFMSTAVFSGNPLFTITPLTATAISLSSAETVTVQYTVTNQSTKTHTLVMEPIEGITQITAGENCSSPFTLTSKQSCTLSLKVRGSQLAGNVLGGPTVCQQEAYGDPSPFLCYRPSLANILNITLVNPNIYAGTANGNVYYSTNSGITWAAATIPSLGNAVNSVFATASTLYAGSADSHVYYSRDNGRTWSSSSATPDASAVNSVFVLSNPGTIYIGTAHGHVYFSTDNGVTWTPTTNKPNVCNIPVNGIYIVSANVLYAGSENGKVYYSADGGTIWTAINGMPDGSAIRNIFIAKNTLYVNTANEYAYSSMDLTGGGGWTPYAQTVFSLFVNSDGSIIDAGTQGGYVYSLSTGNELGFVTASPINSVFVF